MSLDYYLKSLMITFIVLSKHLNKWLNKANILTFVQFQFQKWRKKTKNFFKNIYIFEQRGEILTTLSLASSWALLKLLMASWVSPKLMSTLPLMYKAFMWPFSTSSTWSRDSSAFLKSDSYRFSNIPNFICLWEDLTKTTNEKPWNETTPGS